MRAVEIRLVWLMSCDTPGCLCIEHEEIGENSIECRGCGTRRRKPGSAETRYCPTCERPL